ncbi:uncharacterized protein LOC123307128 [Coccinella septempunctata]|uniref:uncharacterized protein LOC123307128 n=1 Tax=Coccinella septempunctata TaxID=41139 RepID=UPI001D066AE2|nr:uncharacterized protein LOC123307128 [Coccinella septempunctata]
MKLHFRYIRDTSNPFELPDKMFLKMFRLNKKATFSLIVEELSGLVGESIREDTVPFYLQVFASLIFFSSGSYQTNIGEDLNIGISQPAMSTAINRISNLISTHLLAR